MVNIIGELTDIQMVQIACLRITERCADINDAEDTVAFKLHDPIMRLEESVFPTSLLDKAWELTRMSVRS
jgi:hypothetical protein